jgi:hypothetical protein
MCFQLCFELLITHTEDMIEQLKTPSLMEELMEHITHVFPSLSTIFIEERDRYLAREMYSLTLKAGKEALFKWKESGNTKPTLDRKAHIVAVVGMGHQKGIERWWNYYAAGHSMNDDYDINGPIEPNLFDRTMDDGTLILTCLSLYMWMFNSTVVTTVSRIAFIVIVAKGAIKYLRFMIQRRNTKSTCRRRSTTSTTSSCPLNNDCSLNDKSLETSSLPSLVILFDKFMIWDDPLTSAVVCCVILVAMELLLHLHGPAPLTLGLLILLLYRMLKNEIHYHIQCTWGTLRAAKSGTLHAVKSSQ